MRFRGTHLHPPLAIAALTLLGACSSVTEPRSAPLTLHFCDLPVPIWFAYQDNGGAWTRATIGADSTVRVAMGARGGIAFVEQETGSLPYVDVQYATPAEFSAEFAACTQPSAAKGSKRLTGSVAGLIAGDLAEINLGYAWTGASLYAPSFTLNSVGDGPIDLIARRYQQPGSAEIPGGFILRRGQNFTDGSVIPLLDFSASEAATPATGTFTVSGLGSDYGFLDVNFITAGGAEMRLYTDNLSASQTYYGMPADRMTSGDVHTAVAFAYSPTASQGGRVGLLAFTSVGNRSITLGPALATPTVTTIASSPMPLWRARIPFQSEYASFAGANFYQTFGGDITVIVSAAYLSSTPTQWDVSMPDLSAAGFSPIWGLNAGQTTNWNASAYGGATLRDLVGSIRPKDGTVLRAAATGSSVPAGQRAPWLGNRRLRSAVLP